MRDVELSDRVGEDSSSESESTSLGCDSKVYEFDGVALGDVREQAAPCWGAVFEDQVPMLWVEIPGSFVGFNNIFHRAQAAEFWTVKGVEIAAFECLDEIVVV